MGMLVKPDIALNRKRAWLRDPAAVRPCERKERYRSRKQVAQVASRVTNATGVRNDAYHCAVHHCWHTGRPIEGAS